MRNRNWQPFKISHETIAPYAAEPAATTKRYLPAELPLLKKSISEGCKFRKEYLLSATSSILTITVLIYVHA